MSEAAGTPGGQATSIWPPQVWWNDSSPVTFVILRTNGATAVTSKAEEYRAKARECEEHAAQMPDSYIKEQLLEIAKKWRTMAAFEETHGR
jgi:hypothetical protein